ncbi:hypothetical protein EGW08_001301 [Elysia chlorotica]|uniref:ATP-dependent DNA helicase n=1 Tax=Elysia chlorotica TaxID=188477 RepID=A0A3S1A0R1_ELYCH|nr:hypothetical protein EGW08_001301 [Elysia chlorotica]
MTLELHPVLLDVQESLKEYHKYAKKIRCAYEFAASQDLHFFTGLGNNLLQARKFFQLYLVVAYAKIDSERLQILRKEQNRLRADNYQNLKDTTVVRDGDPTNVARQTDVTEEAAKNMALINLEDIIASIDGTSLENHSLPVPTRQANKRKDKEYSRETNYSCEDQGRIADANVQKLTPEQSVIYNDFTQKIQNGQSGLCFLDAPGGCGKTFLIETILASQRAKGSIAIATASTGLAATLLPGGRTVHSTYKYLLT